MKIIILIVFATICIVLNVPQFYENGFNLSEVLGGYGLEFGAALILYLIFDVRDKRNEEKRICREQKRKIKYLSALIDSCFIEDWIVGFLKVPGLPDAMPFFNGYIDDNISQSLAELKSACLETGEYEMAEIVKDLYISKRGQSDLWFFRSLRFSIPDKQEHLDMIKQYIKQYNEKVKKIKDMLKV
ncbi:MAG: hypothetical protein Ta2B_15040 [Termitinemataceae bacterium]|nr:MAG: hypothetical protein Ta2B_15040 [Termitinemataceae bacterium]